MSGGVAVKRDAAAAAPPAGRALERAQLRQVLLITVAAIALYVTLRLLPTGTNLSHQDFRAQGKNSIEFCDPLNPQFIPVVAARSPVTMGVSPAQPPVAGRTLRAVLTLRTASGKPVAPRDLLVVHTRLLHLMVVDPTLTDYQHLHPQPTRTPGEWAFAFTPRFGGSYRLFADFTPVATARGLYASADLGVSGAGAAPPPPDRSPASTGGLHAPVERDGFRFELVSGTRPIKARQPIDLTFRIHANGGGRVPMQPVMGAFAHLVAFDAARTGFAHLHPVQVDPLQPPDAVNPQLAFKLTIPTAGRYVIWAQVNLAGHAVFVPFWFDVSE